MKIVFFIDEFITVKSELKQLQSEITLSPKNQLACSVEVFAKLFLSAESVNSLVSENGVEDQFANRMSIFEETGSLVTRPLYIKKGNSVYFNSVLAYTVRQINGQIEDMQSRGRAIAEMTAETWLNDFIKRYGLDTKYDRLSESLPNFALEIAQYFCDFSDEFLTITENGCFLSRPGKALETFLNLNFDKSEIPALRKKKEELLKSLSDDGKGVSTKRVGKGNFGTMTGIRLKDTDKTEKLVNSYKKRTGK